MSWWQLKDSSGEKNSMLSFAVMGLVVTAFSIVSSIIQKISIGSFEIIFGTVDTTLVLAFFAGTVSAYVTRRSLKEKVKSSQDALEMKMGAGMIDDE